MRRNWDHADCRLLFVAGACWGVIIIIDLNIIITGLNILQGIQLLPSSRKNDEHDKGGYDDTATRDQQQLLSHGLDNIKTIGAYAVRIYLQSQDSRRYGIHQELTDRLLTLRTVTASRTISSQKYRTNVKAHCEYLGHRARRSE